MEHFQPLKTNNKVVLVYLKSKLQQDTYSWCIYLLKYLKWKEKTHLETNKQQTRCRVTDLDVSNVEKWHGLCYEVEIIASKIDGTFSPLKANSNVCFVYLQCKPQKDTRT